MRPQTAVPATITTVAVAAMDRDPEFTFVSGLPDVSNTHDRSAFTSTPAVFDLRFSLASAALVGGAAAWRRRRREACQSPSR
jgi:MYXO-CTERM domain-containing protein